MTYAEIQQKISVYQKEKSELEFSLYGADNWITLYNANCNSTTNTGGGGMTCAQLQILINTRKARISFLDNEIKTLQADPIYVAGLSDQKTRNYTIGIVIVIIVVTLAGIYFYRKYKG